MKNLIFTFLLLVLFNLSYSAEDISAEEDILKGIANKDVFNTKGWKANARAKYFWNKRTFEGKTPITADNILKAYKEAISTIQSKNNSLQSVEWQNIGPVGNPENKGKYGIGRINCIRFRPNSNEIWIGSAGGGAWKSTNDGVSWNEIPYTDVLSICVSDIAFSQQNPNVVYLATGDFDASLSSSNPYYSVGVLKSIDGGNTWTPLSLKYELKSQQIISRIMINPIDDKQILVGGTDGIYKSTNAGETWSKVSSETIADMEFKPGNSETLYVSTANRGGASSILKTTNFGSTFTNLKTINGCFRIAIAVTPANPAKLMAICATTTKYALHSILISENEGNSFDTLMQIGKTGYKNILGWVDGTDDKGQGFYDLTIVINPKNEDDIYTGGVNIWHSTDGGGSFVFSTHWNGQFGKPFVHADYHELIFHPTTNELYVGNDGGIDKYSSVNQKWSNLNANLDIMQFYKIDVDQTSKPNVIAGAQDNGSSLRLNNVWKNVNGGDGMDCAADPLDQQRLYCSIYFGSIYRSVNGGTSFDKVIDTAALRIVYKSPEAGDWVAPFKLDPKNPQTCYVGFNNVWKSDNFGAEGSFQKISNFGFPMSTTLKTIVVSAKDNNYIYAATFGVVYATTDAGKNWKSIYNSSSSVADIVVDENYPDKIYIVKANFVDGDKVVIWHNDTIKNISGNLPNIPVNCIIYQKNSPDRIYVGTDIGVYFSDYNSAKWVKIEGNLPKVVVNDLNINYPTKTLYAGTFGKGVWTTKINEFNAPKVEINTNGNLKFCAGDSVVLSSKLDYPTYLWSNGETTKNIVVKKSGQYYLEIPFDELNSAKSDIININVLDRTALSITPSTTKTILCEGDSVRLTANFGFQTYEWSDGSKKRILDIKQSGNYTLKATNFNDCIENSQEYKFTFLPKPPKEVITELDGVLTAPEGNNYKWYFGDAVIAGESSNTFATKKVGTYKVEYQKDGYCFAITDPIIVLKADVVDEIISNNILIMPNPNNGIFEVHCKENSSTKIFVKNILGQIVFEKDFQNSSIKLDLSFVTKGIYYLEVVQNNDLFVKKVVIE